MKLNLGALIFSLIITSTTLSAETLTLATAIQTGLENSPQIKSAQFKTAGKRAQVTKVTSIALPSVDLGATYSRYQSFQTRLFSELFGGNGNAPTLETYTTDVTVTQSLFNMGVFPALEGANLDYTIAQSNESLETQAAILAITINYINAIKAKHIADLSIENEIRSKTLFDKVKAFEMAGSASKIDRLNAEVAYLQARKTARDAYRQVGIAYRRLSLAMGVPFTDETPLESTLSDDLPFDLIDESFYIQEALENRPEISQMKSTVQLQEIQTNVYKAEFIPNLNFVGKYGYGASDTFRFHKDNEDWSIALAASWNLFNGFQTTGKIQESEAMTDQLEVELIRLQQQVEIEVSESLLNLSSLSNNLRTLDKTVELSNESADATMDKFLSGAASNQEVLDSQFLQHQAQVNRTNAFYDLIVEKIKFLKVLGRLNTDIVDII